MHGWNAEGCGLQEAESTSLDQTCSACRSSSSCEDLLCQTTLHGQKSTKKNLKKKQKQKEWTDYLSNNVKSLMLIILMICASGFDLCPLLEVILYRLLSLALGSGPLSGVERCSLLGGSS